MIVTLPIRTVNTKNVREHWAKRAKRTKQQRGVAFVMTNQLRLECVDSPWTFKALVVTLTRIAPRLLDDGDNLAMSLSAVRDGVADALGVDDRDPRVTWLYSQRKGEPKEYAVEVSVEER